MLIAEAWSRSVRISVSATTGAPASRNAAAQSNACRVMFTADSLRQPWHTGVMRFLTSRVLMPVLARLGSRTILGIGGALFLINMVIPDPLPLVDEFLMLAGTILLSRMAKSAEGRQPGGPAKADAEPKPVGRGSTHH